LSHRLHVGLALGLVLVISSGQELAQTTCGSPLGTGLGCITGFSSTPIACGTTAGPGPLGACHSAAVVGCTSVNGGVLRDISIELRIGEPTPGKLEMGTIVLLSGGSGVSYWDAASKAPQLPQTAASVVDASMDTIRVLHDSGFRTIQVRWPNPQLAPGPAWWEADLDSNLPLSTSTVGMKQEGLPRLACRPATVLRWAYENYVKSSSGTTSKSFCAAGNSAGSSALAYALSKYAQGDGARPSSGSRILDSVVLQSGPVFSRLNDGCTTTQGNPPQYNDPGFRLVQNGNLDKTFGTQSTQGPCTLSASAWNGAASSHFCNNDTTSGATSAECFTPHSSLLNDSDQDQHPGANNDYDATLTMVSAPACLSTTCDLGYTDNAITLSPLPFGCQTSGSPPPDCIVEGDEAPGGFASSDAYYTWVTGATTVTRELVPGQEHEFQARPRGAKTVRRYLLATCTFLP